LGKRPCPNPIVLDAAPSYKMAKPASFDRIEILFGSVPLTCLSWAVCIGLLIPAGAAQSGSVSPDHSTTAGAFVKLEPESLDFGSQLVGSQALPKTVTVMNTSNSSITIADVLTSGIDFSQTNTCTQNLQPGASCAIQVTFKPVIDGERTATLQIDDSAPGSPQRVILTGTGK